MQSTIGPVTLLLGGNKQANLVALRCGSRNGFGALPNDSTLMRSVV